MCFTEIIKINHKTIKHVIVYEIFVTAEVIKSKLIVVILKTSRPAIAGNPRCSVYMLWQKCKREKRASNIALSYGIDVDK